MTNFSKITFTIIVMLFTVVQQSYAVKAVPTPVVITQPDGTKFMARIHGDEFFNYTTTEDGYTIAPSQDGFYYYADYNTGELKLSFLKVGQNTKGIGFSRGVPQSVIEAKRREGKARFFEAYDQALTRAIGAKPLKPKKVLVILAQYTDVQFQTTSTKQAFWDLLNKEKYSDFLATGSAADYFSDNSMGKYRPDFVVTDPVTLPKNRAYYGNLANNGQGRYQEFAKDACRAADPSINFGDFDSDNDGTVDIVLIYYAGHNAAEGVKEAVWPHRSAIGGSYILDGRKIYDYACTSELRGSAGTAFTGIGTMCHEFGHTLGLADVYDTRESSVANSAGMWGRLSLMDAGNYNNAGRTPPYMMAFEREMLGWITIEEIKESGNLTLEQIQNNKAYKIETGNAGEYFIFENRQSTGWDKYINNVVGSAPTGMLIVHIDRSENIVNGIKAAERWAQNEINTYTQHQCADLVEACASEVQTIPIADVFFPGTRKATSFSNISIPNNRPWSGKKSGIDVTKISQSGANVTFEVVKEDIDPQKAQITGKVMDFKNVAMINTKVMMYAAEATTQRISGTKGLYITSPSTTRASGAPLYQTTTNFVGVYEFVNIPKGEYQIEIQVEGYSKFITTIKVDAQQYTQDAILVVPDDSPMLNTLRWWKNVYEDERYIGFADHSPIYTSIVFSPTELSYFKKNVIGNVSVIIDATTGAELTVNSGKTTLIKKVLANSIKGVPLVFDLSADNISKVDNENLSIVIKTQKGVSLDTLSQTIDFRGNLFSKDGKSWASLKSDGKEGNWKISVELTDPLSTIPYIANLNAWTNQNEAFVKWITINPTGVSKWSVRWKKDSDPTYRQLEVEAPKAVLDKLDPNTTYQLEVAPIVTPGTETTNYSKTSFKTGEITAPFPAIRLTEQQYYVGDEILLAIQNKPLNVQQVIYRLDGKPIVEALTFVAEGVYRLTAEITYVTGEVEVIRRQIQVKAAL